MRLGRWLAVLGWFFLLLGVVDLVLLRRGTAPNPPSVLGVIVALAIALFAARAVLLFFFLATRPNCCWTTAAEILVLAGIVISLSAGSVNWLYGLQGYAVLFEGESVRLQKGAETVVFELGPLADLDKMPLTISLDEVELVPAGDGGLYARSVVTLFRGDDEVRCTIDPETSSAVGDLRLYQGAFGFAPRISIEKDGRTLFDRVVPFVTRLHEPTGITFTCHFEVEHADLVVDGSIDLTSLDDALRGHISLSLAVVRLNEPLEARPLGRGTLLPGHFAELKDGYRIGFTGLEKWCEIGVARRNYGKVVMGGGVLVLFGIPIWAVAWWRQKQR